MRTYAQAGVNLDKEAESISALIRQLTFKRKGTGRMLPLLGHFTGLVDFGEYALSLCTDGVGTKILVANAMRKWDTIGIDCIAMNVNDMICVGAEPIAFVDYFAVEKYNAEVARQIGIGLNKGARLANLSVIGGEFATIPEIVRGFDLAGTCLGVVRKKEIITGKDIKVGDLIIGLRSSGIHSNGLTLARKVFEAAGLTYQERVPGLRRSIGEELLVPTSIYVKPVLSLLKKFKLKGMANITGGGLRNLIRLKKNVEFRITSAFKPQSIFRVIQELGRIEDMEMYQTFNMGMGFAIAVSSNEADKVIDDLRGKVEAKIVGEVTRGQGATYPDLNLKYTGY